MHLRPCVLVVSVCLSSIVSAGASARVEQEFGVTPEPPKGPQPAGVSAHNFWFGSQLAWAFPDKGSFVDNLLVSGAVKYFILGDDKDHQGLLTLANLGAITSPSSAGDAETKLAELLRESQGLQIGVQYYNCLTPKTQLAPTVFATAGYKLNGAPTATNSADIRYLHQLRTTVGGEISVGGKFTGKSPATASLTTSWLVALNQTDFSAVLGTTPFRPWLTELTLVLPVAPGVAALLEGNVSTSFPLNWAWSGRVGVIFAASVS